MNKIITTTTAVIILLGLSFNALANNNGGGKNYVLNLTGTGYAYESTVPDIDGDGNDDAATCFDVNLINAKNQQYIGTATDCLSGITGIGDGLALTGTTYFRMPQGTLVVRGNTTVQPVVQATTTPSGQEITHITGASASENAVIHGTGLFAGAIGTARLSGMVNLSDFAGPGTTTPISFDCLFAVSLD